MSGVGAGCRATHRRLVVAIPLLASLAVGCAAQAQGVGGQGIAAQGATAIGSREVLLGTSTYPRTAETPAADRDAQAYYDHAERQRGLGRRDVAQRQLELLIARFPQAAIANVARHDLIALYNDREVPPPQAGRPAPFATASISDLGPKHHLGMPPQVADVPVAIGSSDAASTGWRTATAPGGSANIPSKRPIRTVQDTFRQSAGDLVFFSDGSAELGARARRVLEAQAEWLKSQPTARITIEGHADDSGSAPENLKLSEARAKAVMARLVEVGIAPTRMTILVAGKSQRAADCEDTACAAQNRRVATVIIGQSVAQLGAKLGDKLRDKTASAARAATSGPANSQPNAAANSGTTAGRLPWDQPPASHPR